MNKLLELKRRHSDKYTPAPLPVFRPSWRFVGVSVISAILIVFALGYLVRL